MRQTERNCQHCYPSLSTNTQSDSPGQTPLLRNGRPSLISPSDSADGEHKGVCLCFYVCVCGFLCDSAMNEHICAHVGICKCVCVLSYLVVWYLRGKSLSQHGCRQVRPAPSRVSQVITSWWERGRKVKKGSLLCSFTLHIHQTLMLPKLIWPWLIRETHD